MNDRQQEALQTSIDHITATLANMQQSQAEIQNTLATLPTEERIRQIARDEAAGVFRKNTKQYISEIEDNTAWLRSSINDMQQKFSEMVVGNAVIQKRDDELSKELTKISASVTGLTTRIEDIMSSLHTRQNDIIANVTALRDDHENTTRQITTRINRIEERNDKTFGAVANEISVLTGRNILDENSTRTTESLIERVATHTAQLSDIQVKQANFAITQASIQATLADIKDAPQPLVDWYQRVIPKPVRKAVQSPAFVRAVIALMLSAGGALGFDVFSQLASIVNQAGN